MSTIGIRLRARARIKLGGFVRGAMLCRETSRSACSTLTIRGPRDDERPTKGLLPFSSRASGIEGVTVLFEF